MLQKISKIIYNLVFYLNFIFEKIFKKNFLSWFNTFLVNDSYKLIKINNIDVKFFCPNPLLISRIENFFIDEPETIEWINKFDNKKKIEFWDIGANIGQYSIYAAIIKKNISITSFEPSVNNLQVLARNIYINSLFEKIKIFQLPLSDKQNVFMNMMEEEFLQGAAMNTFGYNLNFEGKNKNYQNMYKIFGTNINFLITNNLVSMPNYIKIDVDGIEHKILEGAELVLKSEELKSILIEINDVYEDQLNSIKNLLTKHGFKFIWKKQVKDLVINTKFKNTFNYLFNKDR
jgi:FkbM family methyltransferase